MSIYIFLDSADERSNMGSPKILIFGERRKCCDLNSRASSLSQATYDEAVVIYYGVLRTNKVSQFRFIKISRALRVGDSMFLSTSLPNSPYHFPVFPDSRPTADRQSADGCMDLFRKESSCLVH